MEEELFSNTLTHSSAARLMGAFHHHNSAEREPDKMTVPNWRIWSQHPTGYVPSSNQSKTVSLLCILRVTR